MKNIIKIAVIFSVSSVVLGCNSISFQESDIVAKSGVSLVSPDGTQIEKSINDLANIEIFENGHRITTPVRISSIEYSWNRQATSLFKSTRFKKGNVIQAAVHYEKTDGEKGVYYIEKLRS